MLDSTFIGI